MYAAGDCVKHGGGEKLKRTAERETKHKITVDIEGLAAMLSCGTSTAKKIAEMAEARIVIGRRVLYSVDKIKAYLEIMTE